MKNYDSNKIRIIPFWLSQYLWVAIALLFLLIGVIYTPYQKIKPIKSNDSTLSNETDLPPTLIMHLTDIHLNPYLQIRAHTFERALSFAAKNNISKLVISGDLVDNKKYELSYGIQSEKDFQHYASEIEKFMKTNSKSKGKSDTYSEEFFEEDSIFDIPGNHDEYGVPSFTSEIHKILDFSKYFQYLSKSGKTELFETLNSVKSNRINLTTFWASRTDITDNIEIISLNPYRHPTPHAKLGFWNHPTTEILDELEKVLSATKKATETEQKEKRTLLVQCHFPIKVMITRQKTSKTHLTMSELFEKFGVDLVLTGHLHPKDPSILHTSKGVLEFVGSDLKGHQGLGIISVDKGNRIFYHSEHFDDIESDGLEGMPNAIVLNPIPIEQISRTSIFNEKEIEIRMICFSNLENISLHSRIEFNSQIFEKDLTFDHFLNENQALYTAKIELPEFGSYKLKITSNNFDLTSSKLPKSTKYIEFNFFVGEEVSIPKEKIYCYPNLVDTAFSGLVIFFFINLFITFPFHFHFSVNHGLNPENLVEGDENVSSGDRNSCDQIIFKFAKKIEETHKWIIGQSDERHIAILLLCGPLLVRRRIASHHIAIQILLFIIAIWPVCLPLIFMTIEGKFAMIWTYGYLCDGKAFYDVFGFIFGFLFEGFLSTSTILIYSMLSVSEPPKFGLMWLDLIVYAICMIFLFFLDFYFVYEASYFGGCFTSPEFALLPLLFIILFIVLACKRRKVVDEATVPTNTGYPDLA